MAGRDREERPARGREVLSAWLLLAAIAAGFVAFSMLNHARQSAPPALLESAAARAP